MRHKSSTHKQQFSNLFIILVVVLITLPLFITSEDLITKFLSYSGLSVLTQKYVIPVEVKFVAAILSIFKIQLVANDRLLVLFKGGTEAYRAQIIWSCIGWQSVVLFFVTLFTGLKRGYTWGSRLETIIIGLMGTFWINIGRIVIIYLLGYYVSHLSAVLFHNFAGTFMVIAWLFVYWWFSYSYVLEERQAQDEQEVINV